VRIGIIGAGIAGLACAEVLQSKSYSVELFDKGRGPGGRLASRTMSTSNGEVCFDYGTQYFTAKDPAFLNKLNEWISEGLVAPWPAAGVDAYVGTPAMSAPVSIMAAKQVVHWGTRVTDVVRRGRIWQLTFQDGRSSYVDLLICATAAEQASPLIKSAAPRFLARLHSAPSAPCLTVAIAFTEPVTVAQDVLWGHDVIWRAVRNNSKPGRRGPECWVVQAGSEWSAVHANADGEWISSALQRALSSLTGVPMPPVSGTKYHRWLYAHSGEEGSRTIFDPDLRLGLCGDWLIGPSVESAWISGTALANFIVQRH